MHKVYLAGKIHGITFEEASGWRNKIKDSLVSCGYEFLDPMDGKDFLTNRREIPVLL